jgi:hypothetical protein
VSTDVTPRRQLHYEILDVGCDGIQFVVPVAAITDKLWAPYFTWAAPLGVIVAPVWDMTQGRTAVVLALIWTAGAFAMFVRLISPIRRERGESRADGIPVSFDPRHPLPAVRGILHSHILLPIGIDRLLSLQEFNAVLSPKWGTPEDETI